MSSFLFLPTFLKLPNDFFSKLSKIIFCEEKKWSALKSGYWNGRTLNITEYFFKSRKESELNKTQSLRQIPNST